MKNPRWRGS